MNGLHHTIYRLKRFVSATIVISLGTWVYHIVQSRYEIRYSKTVTSDGNRIQLNIFNASASPAQIHVSLQSESGGIEDIRLRMHPQTEEWSLREMLPSQEPQLKKLSGETALIQDLDYLADRHRTGGLETLRQKLLTNLRSRIADEIKSTNLKMKDQVDVTMRFMQLTDKHSNLASILPQNISPDLRKNLSARLENVYSKWEREVTQLFGGLAASWRAMTDSTILFPEINLSKPGPTDVMLTIDGHSGLLMAAYSETRAGAANWNLQVFDKEKPAYHVAKEQWLDKDAFTVKYLENPLWGLLWFPAGAALLLMFYLLGWPKNLNEANLYNAAHDDDLDEEIWTEMRRRFGRVEDYLIRRLLVARAEFKPGNCERALPTESTMNLFWRWLRQAVRSGEPVDSSSEVSDKLYDHAETWLMYVCS